MCVCVCLCVGGAACVRVCVCVYKPAQAKATQAKLVEHGDAAGREGGFGVGEGRAELC